MQSTLLSLNADLQRLRDEGFEVEISDANFLLVHNVPYVNAKREIVRGSLASTLELAGNRTVRPTQHVALFVGDEPCRQDGTVITGIQHGANINQSIGNGLIARYSFSNKPTAGYQDYHAKMTRYIDILSYPAMSIDASVTPKTFKPLRDSETGSVFAYLDTASSRIGITEVSAKLRPYKIGIIGLGGSGAYVLDFVAKAPVEQIRLYDADDYLQHNAFRSPGATTLEELEVTPHQKKVDYFAAKYSKMHTRISAHPYRIDETNIEELIDLSFIFVCVDKREARRTILRKLQEMGIPFVDVGMGLRLVEPSKTLVGILRTTTGTKQKFDHVLKRVPNGGEEQADVYDSNIQIAELNALNAALAVIKWKKIAGFYQDQKNEHHSTYSLNLDQMLNEECVDDEE
jgi:tRNA A37 threonylcarbamoyladenosine dehydratase